MISALIEPPPVGIYTYSFLQELYLVSTSFGIILLCVSAVFLAFEQLRSELERLLRYDVVTGALTRRAAYEYGEDLLAHSIRQRVVFSVLMMDLDHFKAINDFHGHQGGDAVLYEFVRSVEQVVRRPSGIGRYGGEEFLLLLPDTSRDEATQVAKRIQSHLRDKDHTPKFTVSIGVASVSPMDRDLNEVISRADAALYRAKKNGRDRIEVDRVAQASSRHADFNDSVD